MKKKVMIKRVTRVGMLCLAMMLLAGCGKKKADANTDTNSSADSKSQVESASEADSDNEGVVTPFIADLEKYDSFISELSADKYYAFAGVGKQCDVLLVTDGVYDYGDGNMAAIDAKIYCLDAGGNVVEVGTVMSDGTAYPLSVYDEYLICGGGHHVEMDFVNNGNLITYKYAEEVFDENAKATYGYFDYDSKFEGEVDDDSKLTELFDIYAKAIVINFNKASANTDTASKADTARSGQAVDFSVVAGEYIFSSGAGAWGTYLTVNPDGSFDGLFSDSDMGDTGDGYPNGTVYWCEFNGAFTGLEKVDEYTYKAKVSSMNYVNEVNTEKIEDEIKYIYTEPYGMTGSGEFEFYMQGKPIARLSSECLDWTFLRWGPIYPTTLPYRMVYNVSEQSGFNEDGYEPVVSNVPQSKEIDLFELAGAYVNDSFSTMNISIYTDVFNVGVGDEVGNISWEQPEDLWIYCPDATIRIDDNGFRCKAEYSGEYSIIITDNTSGAVVFEVYDDEGYDCGTYRMVSHFES